MFPTRYQLVHLTRLVQKNGKESESFEVALQRELLVVTDSPKASADSETGESEQLGHSVGERVSNEDLQTSTSDQEVESAFASLRRGMVSRCISVSVLFNTCDAHRRNALTKISFLKGLACAGEIFLYLRPGQVKK